MSARTTDAQTVGLVGFNPAIAEAVVREFGAKAVRITDLNPQNVGAEQVRRDALGRAHANGRVD